MLNRRAQFIAATLATAMLYAAPAQACQGPQFEHHVILHAMPADAGDVEFIGKVEVRNKRNWYFFPAKDSKGFLARVIESSTHPDLVGTRIEIPPILSTSCGPWLDGGDKGYMAGILEEQDGTSPLLHPKAYRDADFLE